MCVCLCVPVCVRLSVYMSVCVAISVSHLFWTPVYTFRYVLGASARVTTDRKVSTQGVRTEYTWSTAAERLWRRAWHMGAFLCPQNAERRRTSRDAYIRSYCSTYCFVARLGLLPHPYIVLACRPAGRKKKKGGHFIFYNTLTAVSFFSAPHVMLEPQLTTTKVSNTPWGEMHCYVLNAKTGGVEVISGGDVDGPVRYRRAQISVDKCRLRRNAEGACMSEAAGLRSKSVYLYTTPRQRSVHQRHSDDHDTEAFKHTERRSVHERQELSAARETFGRPAHTRGCLRCGFALLEAFPLPCAYGWYILFLRFFARRPRPRIYVRIAKNVR